MHWGNLLHPFLQYVGEMAMRWNIYDIDFIFEQLKIKLSFLHLYKTLLKIHRFDYNFYIVEKYSVNKS